MSNNQQPQADYIRSLQREVALLIDDNKRLKAALAKRVPEMDRLITENKQLPWALDAERERCIKIAEQYQRPEAFCIADRIRRGEK